MATICQLHADLRYYLCLEPVDMRKQFQGLQGIVNAEFGKAMGYLLRHYDELTANLDIADMPVDNNDTERAIRSMVMGKQSYLFCRNDEACQRAAIMYSMLGACKVLGKDPEKWLAYTLKHIGSTKPEHLHRLLPEEWTE